MFFALSFAEFWNESFASNYFNRNDFFPEW